MSDAPRVKLQNQSCPSEMVVFDASPELMEGRAVNYTPLEPVHSPGQMMIYKNTQARTFELSDVKFISRSREEASRNIEKIQIIRSWTMPAFGLNGGGCGGGGSSSQPSEAEKPESSVETSPLPPQPNITVTDNTPVVAGEAEAKGILSSINSGIAAVSKGAAILAGGAAAVSGVIGAFSSLKSAATSAVSSLPGAGGSGGGPIGGGGAGGGGGALGAPPAVLLLSAYSNGRAYTNLRTIPVVIQNLSINYPTDVDYIPTTNGEPFPTIMSISISLVESHSPVEYEHFDLTAFKSGNLIGY